VVTDHKLVAGKQIMSSNNSIDKYQYFVSCYKRRAYTSLNKVLQAVKLLESK